MEELNIFEKTLPDKLDFLIKLKQFVSLEKNSLKKISLAVIFLELMQKNGKSAEIKKINGLEYVYENSTGYYFLVSSKKVGNCYDYENNWYILPLLDFDTLERKVRYGEVVTYTTTSVQVYHENNCPDGKLYFLN